MPQLIDEIRGIIDDYEARGRDCQRAMEMVANLMREQPGETGGGSPAMKRVRTMVKSWEQGDRPALDALETIAAVIRQVIVEGERCL